MLKFLKKIKELEQRIIVLEEFMQVARGIQVEKNLGIDKKKKWLNGYPDETIKGVKTNEREGK